MPPHEEFPKKNLLKLLHLVIKVIFLGLSFNECVKKYIWSKLSPKINCSVVYFDGYIPGEDKSKIKGMK